MWRLLKGDSGEGLLARLWEIEGKRGCVCHGLIFILSAFFSGKAHAPGL